ncbi:MAG: ABC transporter permease [Bacteroidales bacterium]|nr:ABC transporter permease [Bacteroidales bacterium]
MRVILILIKKEFLQVFRNSLLWKILLLAPLAEFLLFPYTADYEIKNVHVAFIDHDKSTLTADIQSKFSASPYFINHGDIASKQEADQMMKNDEIDFIIEFPDQFENAIVRQEQTKILITANAINTVKAGLGSEYVQTVLGNYFTDLGEQALQMSAVPLSALNTTAESSGEAQEMTASVLSHTPQAQLVTTHVYWFNEQMNYQNLIVPGLLIILVTLIGAYVTALNIVREKEIGTIEQVNVTPIKKWQFLLGKMIPFWILGMVEFGAGLVIMKLMFGITIQGSLLLLLGLTSVYLLVMLGLGFFISSMANNQLQAMFIVFFLFILFVMLSGVFTPIEGMPDWAQYINYANPMSFFMSALKTIILKGSTIENIRHQFIVLSVMAVVLNTAALLSYRDKAK